ncbi:ComEA family DNA-binding protein [Aquipseudomonas ullengensis]|uniref:Helix-hairpin-helix domain-containing protein n=1 Tax=Aquipseudomonas ullengensis TaxID=2759166 RepID=A0A7W4LKW0_9GAMM|nr:helix-hairpin-helix domain-containing protein [Pseudomonas ullengensis]MBB2494996.1 helix-hairpin-helix domain-containing protein [Pseudomonas ullengensis]
MLNVKLSALLFACLTSLSVSVFAVESAKTETSPAEISQAVAGAEVGKVNLNTADVATLESELVGIGKVKAQAIVDHRTANGPFASVDELLEVKGIGAATLEKNRDKLNIN